MLIPETLGWSLDVSDPATPTKTLRFETHPYDMPMACYGAKAECHQFEIMFQNSPYPAIGSPLP